MRCRLLGVMGGVTLVSSLLCFLVSLDAHAADFSWTNHEPVAKVREDLVSPYQNGEEQPVTPKGCSYQNIYIGNLALATDKVCVYQADGFRYGILNKWISHGYYGYSDQSFLIGLPGESRMYRVEGVPIHEIIWVPNSKHLTFRFFLPWSSWGYNLYIVKDIRSKLIKMTRSDLSTGYKLVDGVIDPLLKNENNDPLMTRMVGVSDNGRWLVTELRPGGLLRVDMQNFDKVWFSRYTPSYGYGSDGHIEFAVSDDGHRVASVGLNVDPRITELTDNCGRSVDIFYEAWRGSVLVSPCPERQIYWLVSDAIGGDLRNVYFPEFDSGGGELMVYATPYSRQGIEYKETWVSLTAAGYVPVGLEYLALGDSYSSGEGDTVVNPATKRKYYRQYTDSEENRVIYQPREKCHVSSRSYPYLLATGMNLASENSKRWNTVACSGATAWDVKLQGSRDYMGQGRGARNDNTPRLKGYDATLLKAQALNEYIPGRQKQIEFVEKYQPKVITLTMGGNDIGFGDKIQSCITPGTCRAATEEGKGPLASQVEDQYDNLKSLYEELYVASGSKAKIYVLGYPQFINKDKDASCPRNIGFLNADERKMIFEGVNYLNRVIKQAAKSAGVKYINVEDSLEGHRLCDNGEAYVTGIAARGSSENQESFHPNAKGNAAIANSIWDNVNSESLLDYGICPHISTSSCPDSSATKDNIGKIDYFQSSGVQVRSQYKEMAFGEKVKGAAVGIFTGLYSLAPGSTARLTLHSDPVDLGTYVVGGDGSLSMDIIIPSIVPAGYHTLVLSGETYSGEVVEYEQVVLIQGSDLNDIDENGVPDDQQQCFFMPESGVDSDLDGIDDTCDLEIPKVATTSGLLNDTDSSPFGNRLNDTAQSVRINDSTANNKESRLRLQTLAIKTPSVSQTSLMSNLFFQTLFTVVGIVITIVSLIFKHRRNAKVIKQKFKKESM